MTVQRGSCPSFSVVSGDLAWLAFFATGRRKIAKLNAQIIFPS